MKIIKVEDQLHRQLKIEAAKEGKRITDIIGGLMEKNKSEAKS